MANLNDGGRHGAGLRGEPIADVRAATPADTPAWLRMRCALWPEATLAEHREEIARYFAREASLPVATYLASDAAGAPVGFAEVAIRSVAEGCHSGWIAYLEGWYVEPASRSRGTGRALVRAAEAWALAQGCREFASDTRFLDSAGARAHAALGFTEVEQLRCFRKTL